MWLKKFKLLKGKKMLIEELIEHYLNELCFPDNLTKDQIAEYKCFIYRFTICFLAEID